MSALAESHRQQAFSRKMVRLARAVEAQPPVAPADVRSGLPYERLDALVTELGLAASTVARVLGISERSLARRRAEGRLGPVESDRLWRLRYVVDQAVEAFDGDREEARRWLTSARRALGDDTPIEHLDTEPGARRVEQMLAAMDLTMPV